MQSIQIKISFLGFLILLFFKSGFPLWAHKGPYIKNPLFLEYATESLKFEETATVNLAEEPVQLSDYQGKVILLNFWATWCTPCQKEMRDIHRLAKKFKNRPFQVVTLNFQESPETIKQFYKKLRIRFETLLDPKGEVFQNYSTETLPTTYIIDMQGFIIARAIGPRKWNSKESIEYFDHLLMDEESSKQENLKNEATKH